MIDFRKVRKPTHRTLAMQCTLDLTSILDELLLVLFS